MYVTSYRRENLAETGQVRRHSKRQGPVGSFDARSRTQRQAYRAPESDKFFSPTQKKQQQRKRP